MAEWFQKRYLNNNNIKKQRKILSLKKLLYIVWLWTYITKETFHAKYVISFKIIFHSASRRLILLDSGE